VRTLAEDMGEVLGCGAHVVGLRRTGVGPYTSEGMVTLDQLKALYEQDKFQLDKLLIPIDSALADWPAVQLNEDAAYYLKMGQPVLVPKAPTEGRVRLYDASGQFLGVGEVEDDGRIAPRRLMSGG
jgi:tRNA pseudouridine55 synthase